MIFLDENKEEYLRISEQRKTLLRDSTKSTNYERKKYQLGHIKIKTSHQKIVLKI